MYIAGIDYESFADGPGVRAVLFISGCYHKCKGCHSPETHSFTYGTLVTDELIDKINEELIKRPFLSGITLSGGDPMYSYKEIYELLNKLYIPKNNIWMFTGFEWEHLLHYNRKETEINSIYGGAIAPIDLIKRCEVIVDGPFVEELRDITLKFRGSKNQRLIDVKKTLENNKGEIILYESV